MTRRKRFLIMMLPIISCLLISGGVASAQTTSFTYQGRLNDNGSPANGTYDLQFALFDSLSGGTQIGATQSVSTVSVSAGVFTVQLNFGASAFPGASRFLEISVRPSGGGSFTTLSPRQPISSTPYAIRSLNSSSADAVVVSGVPAGNGNYIQNTTTQQASSNFNISGNGTAGGTLSASSLGLGTASPTARLSIRGAGAFNAVGAARFDLFNTTANNGFLQHVTDGGLWQLASTSGATRMVVDSVGNVGIGTSGPSNTLSVNGGADFTGNVGMGTSAPAHRLSLIGGPAWTSNGWTGALELGNASAIGWRANAGGQRFGIGQSGGGLYFFRTLSNPGTTGSPANYDLTISDAGYVGIGTTTPGTKLEVNGGGLNAIYGYSTNGLGLWGVSSTNGGVLGTGYVGAQGNTNGDVNSQGVRGDNGGSNTVGYAGLFNGRAWVVGNLQKGGGSFKIDHPLDPENKYLYHSFVESPDMKNIYDGVITTDERGEATVMLPDYFMALNRDFRYQLTVIGQFAQAIVVDEIKDNRFTIKTDKPTVKVSWQVTGIRQDAYANANRIVVEEDKTEKERGYYIHPQAFGLPEEKSVQWALYPEMMRQAKEQREKAQQNLQKKQD